MKDIAALQKQIGAYSKTRDVYAAYRKAGYSKKYIAEHEGDIAAHKAAKKYFDGLGLEKLPTLAAKQNAESLLNYWETAQAKENERMYCGS